MHLLFLARELPLPANNGTRLRTWALLRALAAEGHAVTLLAFARAGETGLADVSAMRDVCREVELVPLAIESLSATANLGARARALPRPRPYSVGRFRSAEMRRVVRRRLTAGGVDAVVCDVFTAVNLPDTRAPIVLNHENVEHIILRRYCDVERTSAKRAYAWLEYLKMRRWEQVTCGRARVGLACSGLDARTLSALAPSLPIVIAPNIVDMAGDPPAAAEDSATILFQGGMDWLPNRDAVAFFASAILPRVQERLPGAKFLVAGRNPSPEFVASFAHIRGMSFTGTVSDMQPVIARATISVAPLRIGSGTRLKILEAAALGKAVVATEVGAEGLDFVEGEEIVIADEPIQFAERVVELLGDPARRRAIGAAARRRAEQHYSLAALQQAVVRAAAHVRPNAGAVPDPARKPSPLAP